MGIAGYIRVSTEDQNFDRQLEATHDYAQNTLEAEPPEIETYRDKSTGTNTERSGYHDLMDAVEAGEHDAVVVKSISRVARSIRDLEATAERIREAGAELHVIDENLILQPEGDDPYQAALFRLLGVFAQLEAEMAQQRTKEGIASRRQEEDYHHGRPPLGFETDDGHLVPAENYDQVVATLDLVIDDNLSKRAAAKELDTSRSTIDRALDRADLYGL
ncbi:MAG: recombinase family protein [Halanaeroarchaeum sp.]